MIIDVNDNYRIVSTPHSWDVEERQPGGRWSKRFYHQNLDSAAKALAQYMIRKIESQDLNEIIKKVDEVLAAIVASMPDWAKGRASVEPCLINPY